MRPNDTRWLLYERKESHFEHDGEHRNAAESKTKTYANRIPFRTEHVGVLVADALRNSTLVFSTSAVYFDPFETTTTLFLLFLPKHVDLVGDASTFFKDVLFQPE